MRKKFNTVTDASLNNCQENIGNILWGQWSFFSDNGLDEYCYVHRTRTWWSDIFRLGKISWMAYSCISNPCHSRMVPAQILLGRWMEGEFNIFKLRRLYPYFRIGRMLIMTLSNVRISKSKCVFNFFIFLLFPAITWRCKTSKVLGTFGSQQEVWIQRQRGYL